MFELPVLYVYFFETYFVIEDKNMVKFGILYEFYGSFCNGIKFTDHSW